MYYRLTLYFRINSFNASILVQDKLSGTGRAIGQCVNCDGVTNGELSDLLSRNLDSQMFHLTVTKRLSCKVTGRNSPSRD